MRTSHDIIFFSLVLQGSGTPALVVGSGPLVVGSFVKQLILGPTHFDPPILYPLVKVHITGWWFVTFLSFPYIGNDDPI